MSARFALSLACSAALLGTLALSGCAPAVTGGTQTGGSPSTANSAPPAQNNTSAAGVLPQHCPSASAMSAVMGSSQPAPNETRETKLLTCIYLSGSTVHAILLYEPMPAGITIDEMKALVQKKTPGTLTSFSGVGDGGFSGKADDGQTIVYLLKDGLQIAISSKQSADQLEQEAGKVPTS